MSTNSESVCSKCEKTFSNIIHSINNRNKAIRVDAHMFQSGNDTPLTVAVEGGQIVVRIGIGTNAWAFEHNNENNPFDDAKNDFVQKYKITDPMEFAQDVVCAMQDEGEDGSTSLTDFLDKMNEAAVNDGSMGVEEDTSGTSAYAKDGK